jgi:hypothetical protein
VKIEFIAEEKPGKKTYSLEGGCLSRRIIMKF